MKQKLLDELMKVSEEEQKYLDGQGNIERQLYVNEKLEEIDRERLLRRGQLITVRPHSRFVDFPEHRHNYVEIMYVVQGSITHSQEEELDNRSFKEELNVCSLNTSSLSGSFAGIT